MLSKTDDDVPLKGMRYTTTEESWVHNIALFSLHQNAIRETW